VLNWYIRDKQPPEVVEAARRQMADSDTGGGYARYSREDLMLINSFIRDARKFIAALDKFCQDYNWLQNEEDLEKFTITVHGVKSSLGIIGETKMSSMAARLERAGRDGNVDLIKDSVFGFLEDLRALLAELVTKRNAGCVDEDIGVLRKKLMSIKEACAIQSREAALGIIADIVNGSEKTWAVIDAITEHIMHSEFEEALGEAAAYAEEMHQQLIW
jgi:HPt (histidine-containing phosphotransfer) domain-containing protein